MEVSDVNKVTPLYHDLVYLHVTIVMTFYGKMGYGRIRIIKRDPLQRCASSPQWRKPANIGQGQCHHLSVDLNK